MKSLIILGTLLCGSVVAPRAQADTLVALKNSESKVVYVDPAEIKLIVELSPSNLYEIYVSDSMVKVVVKDIHSLSKYLK